MRQFGSYNSVGVGRGTGDEKMGITVAELVFDRLRYKVCSIRLKSFDYMNMKLLLI